MTKRILTILLSVLTCAWAWASPDSATDSIADSPTELREVSVAAPRGVRKLKGATNSELISASELKRAACCNLGESFTTNPSVDVNYSDAATGARQIKLLGLSGGYVQMMTENIPNFRGAAAPYGLGYVAGPWMQSIQVSKGTSSVKNGYESITGQINVEIKKPQADPSLSVNMYYDQLNKLEANVDGNWHFGENWSAGLLTHYEDRFSTHDGNDDGFVDMPRIKQFAAMPRVAYLGSKYVFQAAGKILGEKREGGQLGMHGTAMHNPYLINIDTKRGELFTKNAFMYDRENDGNVALILSGSLHDQNASYGIRVADILQRDLYGSLMYERKWNDGMHALSTGLSGTYDSFDYHTLLNPASADQTPVKSSENEAVGGAYAQYTLSLDNKLTAMAGLRYDYSNLYGGLVTPRLHLRYNPLSDVSLHASVGTGARSPHPIAEYSYMLASSRRFEVAPDLKREKALNTGGGFTATFRPWGKKTTLSGEYYYTGFSRQLLLNLDADPHAAIISTPSSRSYSHAVQTELTFDPTSELSLSAAWRYTDVKADYGHGLQQKPLTSRSKALFTASYAPMMGMWQFDTSLALNGGGRMPTPYTTADGSLSWNTTFKGYPTLNAQITRNFRRFSVYAGGENLTGFRQPNPIVEASDPWGSKFDATMIYGPLHGALIYAGFRYNITKYL